MPKKLKILISAYACGPHRGSEPGMGWNFVLGLSKFHEVHVISEREKWQKPVQEFLQNHPELSQNLKFYFIQKKRNRNLRKIWPPSYYWYYRQWQKKAFELSLQLEIKENFNLIHQLNMVGYREPGFLWRINKPFVWGPIGGLENSPWRFLPSLGLKGLAYYSGRNTFNFFQRRFSERPRRAATLSRSSLIAATPGNAKIIAKLWGVEARVICEVGRENGKNTFTLNTRSSKNDPLKLVWSGLHTPGKNLGLLIAALEKVRFPYELHVLGEGEMTSKWKKYANRKGVLKHSKWYGWVERTEAIEIMSLGHVFCITSISDLTSTVTLEALSSGLPIVCLDHCGFAHVVTESCGIKIAADFPSKAAESLGLALQRLYDDENYRQKLCHGAIKRAEVFQWDQKIDTLNKVYVDAINL